MNQFEYLRRANHAPEHLDRHHRGYYRRGYCAKLDGTGIVSCRLVNEACSADDDCCAGKCNANGVCGAEDTCVADGQACTEDGECCSLYCDPDTLLCDETTRTCVSVGGDCSTEACCEGFDTPDGDDCIELDSGACIRERTSSFKTKRSWACSSAVASQADTTGSGATRALHHDTAPA